MERGLRSVELSIPGYSTQDDPHARLKAVQAEVPPDTIIADAQGRVIVKGSDNTLRAGAKAAWGQQSSFGAPAPIERAGVRHLHPDDPLRQAALAYTSPSRRKDKKRAVNVTARCFECKFEKNVVRHFSKAQMKKNDRARCNECIAGEPPSRDPQVDSSSIPKPPRGFEGRLCWGCNSVATGHEVTCISCEAEYKQHRVPAKEWFCTPECKRKHRDMHAAWHVKRRTEPNFELSIGEKLPESDIQEILNSFRDQLRIAQASGNGDGSGAGGTSMPVGLVRGDIEPSVSVYVRSFENISMVDPNKPRDKDAVEIAIPPEATPGKTFMMQVGEGDVIEFKVPEGMRPGDKILLPRPRGRPDARGDMADLMRLKAQGIEGAFPSVPFVEGAADFADQMEEQH